MSVSRAIFEFPKITPPENVTAAVDPYSVEFAASKSTPHAYPLNILAKKMRMYIKRFNQFFTQSPEQNDRYWVRVSKKFKKCDGHSITIKNFSVNIDDMAPYSDIFFASRLVELFDVVLFVDCYMYSGDSIYGVFTTTWLDNYIDNLRRQHELTSNKNYLMDLMAEEERKLYNELQQIDYTARIELANADDDEDALAKFHKKIVSGKVAYDESLKQVHQTYIEKLSELNSGKRYFKLQILEVYPELDFKEIMLEQL